MKKIFGGHLDQNMFFSSCLRVGWSCWWFFVRQFHQKSIHWHKLFAFHISFITDSDGAAWRFCEKKINPLVLPPRLRLPLVLTERHPSDIGQELQFWHKIEKNWAFFCRKRYPRVLDRLCTTSLNYGLLFQNRL